MDEKIIKEKLLEAGYPDNTALHPTVKRLHSLTGKPKEMLEHWLSTGELTQFEPIEGYDADTLKSKLGMKDAAVILTYAMLTDPKEKPATLLMLNRLSRGQFFFKPKL